MSMTAIEQEIIDVCKIKKPKTGERQKWLDTCVKAVAELEDDAWDALSSDASSWYNGAVEAVHQGGNIPEPPGAEGEAEDDGADANEKGDSEAAASTSENGEEEDDNDDDPLSDDDKTTEEEARKMESQDFLSQYVATASKEKAQVRTRARLENKTKAKSPAKFEVKQRKPGRPPLNVKSGKAKAAAPKARQAKPRGNGTSGSYATLVRLVINNPTIPTEALMTKINGKGDYHMSRLTTSVLKGRTLAVLRILKEEGKLRGVQI